MSTTTQVRELLSQSWRPAVEVEEEAAALGITARQVRTAKAKLGVSLETGSVMRKDGKWWWRLPDGQCPTCGGHLRGPWGLPDRTGDYWAGRGAVSVAIEDDEPANPPQPETPSVTMPPAPVPRYEPARPVRCSICGRASASAPGEQCPFQTSTGVRCVGTVE